MHPTRLGIKGVLFMAALLTVFLATPYSNLFFLLIAFLAVLAVCGPLWCWQNLRGVQVELLTAGTSAAGEPHPVRLRVRARRPRLHLVLQLRVAGRWRNAAVLARPYGTGEADGEVVDLPRGVHAIEGARLVSRYPLGICECRRRLVLAGELVVHPRPAPLGRTATPRAAIAELCGAAVGGEDLVVVGLREYRTGDAVRAVHWKATARRGTPVVREYDREAGETLALVLDRRLPAQAFEQGLGEATALVLRAQANKTPLRLLSQGLQQTFGPDHAPFAAALRWLADAGPLGGGDGPPPALPGALPLPLRRTEAADA